MARHDRGLNLAIELAKKNPNSQHKHGAVYVCGGSVLSVGLNTERKGFFMSRHAEWHAIREHLDRRGTLYVARFKRSGVIGNSEPCNHCMNQLLNYSRAREVLFTQATHLVGHFNLDNISSTW